MMKTILVADDDKFFRDLISDALSACGCRVVTVCQGKEVIRELSENDYACLVVDLHMEGLSGEQTISLVREMRPALPIVAITGDRSLALEQRVRTHGITGYLIKPFDMRELADLVTAA